MSAAGTWSDSLGQSWAAHADGLEATLRPFNTALADALNMNTPLRIADIGCGGGGLSRYLTRHAPSGSHVTGIDISPALIDHARQFQKDEVDCLDFVCADAETATRADVSPTEEAFDALTSRFGVMFFFR